MNVQNGDFVKDRLTGFEGRVAGIVSYLSGCVQALVLPSVQPDGKLPDSVWFDVQRLEVDTKKDRVVLDNGPTPGCDRVPTRR